MTAMSIDRFVAIVYPNCYLGISMTIYRLTDIYLYTTFPLTTTLSAYLAMHLLLKKQSREDLQRQKIILAANTTLHSSRRLRIGQMEGSLP